MNVRKFLTNSPLDKLLDGGIECGVITNVYGPAGSGKSNICLTSLLQAKNKTLYIDSEGSFSLDRFRQIGGDEKKLKNIIFIDVHTWKDQYEQMIRLDKIIQKDKIDIVIVDSIVSLYRLELDNTDKEKVSRTNMQLGAVYSVLSRIARERNIPILVTNQVYGSGEDIEPTSKTIARYWSKCLIEFKKLDKDNCRKAIIRKHRSLPEGKQIDFEIYQKGIKEYRKLF
ncbi:MAG: DNA repair and recombination protein RadB [Candidatus Aenigmarchaeota archaeon]|nr:DNA repair and recombination protein RadB [Candidatus Aenigmarchaeota archaeon]